MIPPKFTTILGSLVFGCFSLCASAYEFFSEDFEAIADPQPEVEGGPFPGLGNGMIVGATVFDASNNWQGGYYGFPAPNIVGDKARFCNVATGQGGPEQGNKVLTVFSDYTSTFGGSLVHQDGRLIDSNVWFEVPLEEADLGTTVSFQFDAKFDAAFFDLTPLTGVPEGSAPSFNPEAEAFLKVLTPPTFSVAVSDTADPITEFTTTWGTYTLTIAIPDDPSWIGRVLQAGFRNKTSQYQSSAVFYDNLLLTSDRVVVAPQPIKILSLERPNSEEFAITFEAEPGSSYELQKWNPTTEAWDYVFDITAVSTEELLDDVEAFEPTAIYRIIKL